MPRNDIEGGREAAKAGAGIMPARVVALRFDPLLEAFDAPFQEFLKAREVFAIRDHFFIRNEVP